MTPLLAPAVIEVAFDPLVRVGEMTLRWQTIGVTAAALLALAVTAIAMSDEPPQRGGAAERRSLRLEDLGYMVLASVPGAVIGGRMVHGIVFWAAYEDDPVRLLDPSLGSLSLLGAVLGGALTAAYLARLLNAPIGRWADVAAVPLLLALALGKVAQFLGGSGQGAPFAGPWAVAFVGEGPWVSANPQLPSHPAQLYEAGWLLIGVVLLVSVAAGTRAERQAQPGWLFLAALIVFLLGRLLVGFVWRDERLVGLLNVEQALALVTLVVVVVAGAAWYLLSAWRRRE